MKNPKLLFLSNLILVIYLGLITFYLFKDFLLFEGFKSHNHTDGANGEKTSMFKESAAYFNSEEHKPMVNLKIYLIVHNILLIFVLRMSLSR